MFVLDETPSFVWPVTYRQPGGQGQMKVQKLKLEFKRIDRSELTAKLQDASLNDNDFCKEIVIGWSEVYANSKEVPYSDEKFSEILEKKIGLARAIADTYIRVMNGDGAAKN